MDDWNTKTKFWAETLRIIIIGIIGGWIAHTYLDPQKRNAEATVRYKAELAKQKLVIQTKIIDEFFDLSYSYTTNIYDLLNKEEDVDKDKIESFYDDYRSVQNLVGIYFKDLDSVDIKLKKIEQTTNALFKYTKDKLSVREQWNPVRDELKRQNNELGVYILKELNFFKKNKDNL